jgi:BA14K-like protein
VTDLSIQAKARISAISLPTDSRRRQTMTRFKILGAAAILSLISATPVFAQAAIQEPGAFAFYYPNNDVLNGGRPTPAAGLDAKMPLLFGSNPYAAMGSSSDGASCARYRSYDPSSGTFLGRDGRRHAC